MSRGGRPVGRGYMPKGGVAAAKAHNERVMASATAPAEPVRVEPVTDVDRTGVRASARPVGRRTALLVTLGTSAVVSVVSTLSVEWLVRS